MKMPKRKRKKIVSAGKKHTQRLKAYTSPKGRQDLKAGGNNKSRRSITKAMRFEILRRDNYKCSICGASPAVNPMIILHIDHIVPLSKGGDTNAENLQTLCSDCNLGKGAKTMRKNSKLKKTK